VVYLGQAHEQFSALGHGLGSVEGKIEKCPLQTAGACVHLDRLGRQFELELDPGTKALKERLALSEQLPELDKVSRLFFPPEQSDSPLKGGTRDEQLLAQRRGSLLGRKLKAAERYEQLVLDIVHYGVRRFPSHKSL
jgi:hypothetical protein